MKYFGLEDMELDTGLGPQDMFISWYKGRKQDERLSKVAQQVSMEVIGTGFSVFIEPN